MKVWIWIVLIVVIAGGAFAIGYFVMGGSDSTAAAKPSTTPSTPATPAAA